MCSALLLCACYMLILFIQVSGDTQFPSIIASPMYLTHTSPHDVSALGLITVCVPVCLHHSSDAEDWFCKCPPLYTGQLCQFMTCDRNPCSHGATCMPKSPLEAVCLCPYGRQGLLCEEGKSNSITRFRR